MGTEQCAVVVVNSKSWKSVFLRIPGPHLPAEKANKSGTERRRARENVNGSNMESVGGKNGVGQPIRDNVVDGRCHC